MPLFAVFLFVHVFVCLFLGISAIFCFPKETRDEQAMEMCQSFGQWENQIMYSLDIQRSWLALVQDRISKFVARWRGPRLWIIRVWKSPSWLLLSGSYLLPVRFLIILMLESVVGLSAQRGLVVTFELIPGFFKPKSHRAKFLISRSLKITTD